MKISKMSQLILGLGILIITLGSLGVARSQQLNEVKLLSDNLSVAQLRLNKLDLQGLYSQQEKLNAQIVQATSQVDAAKASLSLPNDSITVSDAIFRIAETAGVEVAQISSGIITNDKVGGVACLTLPVAVQVTGDVPNLIDFVMRLNRDFSIGIVKTAEIAVPKTSGAATDNSTGIATDDTSGETTDNATEPAIVQTIDPSIKRPSAQVQLAIYAYKG